MKRKMLLNRLNRLAFCSKTLVEANIIDKVDLYYNRLLGQNETKLFQTFISRVMSPVKLIFFLSKS